MVDPLMGPYLLVLLETRRVRCHDVLGSVFARSKYRPQPEPKATKMEKARDSVPNPGALGPLEPLAIEAVTRTIFLGKRPIPPDEATGIFYYLVEWMMALSSLNNALLQAVDQQAGAMCDGVGLLAIACLENQTLANAIDKRLPERESLNLELVKLC